MNIRRISLVAFSPCRTTLASLRAIAAGCGCPVTEYDMTLPPARGTLREFGPDDLVLLGFPVYGGRLPRNAGEVFSALKGSDTPAVLAAVYGNRDYEDALLEMQHEARKRGFIAVAAAAPVAEHCMVPDVAANRPDAADAGILGRFGDAVTRYIRALSSPQDAGFSAPGEFPYRKEVMRANAAPKATEACTRCGTCVSVCPAGAIPAGGPEAADDEMCISCMACVKFCPESARKPVLPTLGQLRERLRATCMARKEPRFFPETIAPR